MTARRRVALCPATVSRALTSAPHRPILSTDMTPALTASQSIRGHALSARLRDGTPLRPSSPALWRFAVVLAALVLAASCVHAQLPDEAAPAPVPPLAADRRHSIHKTVSKSPASVFRRHLRRATRGGPSRIQGQLPGVRFQAQPPVPEGSKPGKMTHLIGGHGVGG